VHVWHEHHRSRSGASGETSTLGSLPSVEKRAKFEPLEKPKSDTCEWCVKEGRY
jgi:hypothetical protein